MKATIIIVKDVSAYCFSSDEYTETEAIEQAKEWFSERDPEIEIQKMSVEEAEKYGFFI